MLNVPWIPVEDYGQAAGWVQPEQREARARAYCGMLERGQILFFRDLPFRLPAEDREFLITQEWGEMRLHKNVSYRPANIGLNRVGVLNRDDSRDACAVSRYAGTALVLTADKEGKSAMLHPGFKASKLLPAVAVGASKIVG